MLHTNYFLFGVTYNQEVLLWEEKLADSNFNMSLKASFWTQIRYSLCLYILCPPAQTFFLTHNTNNAKKKYCKEWKGNVPVARTVQENVRAIS
jgi:hypothetical protein